MNAHESRSPNANPSPAATTQPTCAAAAAAYEPAQRRRFRLPRALVWPVRVWIALFLACLLLAVVDYFDAPLTALITLTFGWISYGWLVITHIGHHWPILANALGLAVLSWFTLHRIMRRQARMRAGQSSSAATAGDDPAITDKNRWRRRTTGVMLALLMMATAFTLCAGAVFHHVVWLMRQDQWTKSTWNLDGPDSQVRAVRIFMHFLTDWHDQTSTQDGTAYRPSEVLTALKSETEPDYSLFSILRQRGSSSIAMPELWIMIDGVPLDGDPDLPVLVSMIDGDSRIIVATPRDWAAVMTRNEWLEALDEWRPQFAENGIPWPPAFEVLGR